MPAGMMVLSDASRARNYTRNTKHRIARKAAARYRKKNKRYGRYKKKKPTLKSISLSVKRLYQRDDKKFYYTRINNLLVSGGPSAAQEFQGVFSVAQIPYSGSTDPGTGVAYPGYSTREPDSAVCNLRNIRIHMTLHASHNEAYINQKCYVALIKSRVGVGSPTGIVCPKMTEIWDYLGAGAGNLLAPWELFRNTQGPGAELLKDSTFKILKDWTVYLQPQRGAIQQSLRTTNVATASGSIISNPIVTPPGVPINFTYAKTRPSEVLIKYTQNLMNAKVKFPNTATDQSNNVKYFLVMVGQGTDTTRGFRINASIKTNFIDE